MGLLNKYLNCIRGYDIVTGDDGSEIKIYRTEYYSYEKVINAFVKSVNILATDKWHINVSGVNTITEQKFGPNIRKAIANVVLDFSTKAEKPQYATYWEILGVHYGRDLRDILYNFLIEFGAEELQSKEFVLNKSRLDNDFLV